MWRLERDRDQIYIGNKKLHINIPRYRRSEVEPKRVEGRNTRNVQEEAPVLQEQKTTKEVWNVKSGRKSFVDVVKGDSQRMWKGPIIKTEQQVLPWMECSVIRQFREELYFEQLWVKSL